MNKKLRTATALLLSGCLMTGNVFAATTTFKDVPTSYWGHQYITRAAEEGLVSGMGGGVYGVNAKLSNAQFVTMVCNLFYKSDVDAYQKTYKPADWWYSYMAVAYSKGLLTGTVAAQGYNVTKKWTAAAVNAEISRYDMAQVMVNVSETRGWQAPSSLEILTAQRKIADWDKIPANYQRAVAVAYAKGYLSGMDDIGTFKGSESMNRTHGAVVVCKLLDAKATSAAPVYTNTTKLVNGSTPTEKNVETALTMLQWEFPRGYTWNMSSLYTSPVMGTGTGNQAFAYMLNDKVFGNMKASVSSADELKPGDLVYLRNSRTYVVVEDVDDDEFTYVYCDNNGKVSWGNTSDIDDLGKSDTVYTRYKATESSDGELADGSKATERNAYDLLMDVKDEYSGSDKWEMDEKYKSTAFYKNYVDGDRAFAYYASDEVFGDLPVESFDGDDADEARVGDVIYLYDEEVWGIVVENDGDTITYAAAKTSGSSKGKVEWSKTVDVDDMDDDDTIYTRYPDSSSGSSSQKKNTLSNGSSATERNAAKLLDDVQDEYSGNDKWDMDEDYKSTAFYRNYVDGDRAFAYYASDEVFGNLPVDSFDGDDADEARVGDVIYLYDEEVWGIVVDNDGDTITYAAPKSTGKVEWSKTVDVDDMDDDDTIYTRYPDGSSGSSSRDDDELADGSKATERNAAKLLDDVQDEYSGNDKWDMDEDYKSTAFYKNYVDGDRAFAYYASDEIFGDLSVESFDGDDADEARVGDVIYLYDEEVWGVVVDNDGDTITYAAPKSTGKVEWNKTVDVDDMDDDDTLYTRYPD